LYGDKMKNKISSITTIFILLTSTIVFCIPVFAKPTAITVEFNQAQDQWRGTSEFGDWTPGYSYLESATSTDFELKGNTLHTSWSYSPLVSDLQGESTVYVYDKKTELWIEKEGTVSYIYEPGYGEYPAVNYFRGYLDFGGLEPSTSNFVYGVAYQWIYLFAPEDAELEGTYTANAMWDETMNAWLVGFSIYRWSETAPLSALEFPESFPEPVPANNYNPLDL
jgi:hypothetical protein